jgi:hypothetical protein
MPSSFEINDVSWLYPLRLCARKGSSLSLRFAIEQHQLFFSHLCKSSHYPVYRKFKQLHFGTRPAMYRARLSEMEDTKMKTTLSRKTAYIGAGAGLVLFAIFGLLPGGLLGGAAGIRLSTMLFGLPLDAGIVSRMIVLVSMLLGILVSGITIVTSSAILGWLAGAVFQDEASEETAAAGSK